MFLASAGSSVGCRPRFGSHRLRTAPECRQLPDRGALIQRVGEADWSPNATTPSSPGKRVREAGGFVDVHRLRRTKSLRRGRGEKVARWGIGRAGFGRLGSFDASAVTLEVGSALLAGPAAVESFGSSTVVWCRSLLRFCLSRGPRRIDRQESRSGFP